MAKSAKDETDALDAINETDASVPPKMVLKKNHGMVLHGRVNKFFPAGTEFDLTADAEIISKLIQSGAQLE